MNTKEKIEVMQAYLDGELVQLRRGQEWLDWDQEEDGEPFWNWDLDKWRIKPKEVVKPSIDWSHVSPKYKYLAMDRNGDVYLYTNKPVCDVECGEWDSSGGGLTDAASFTSFEAPEDVEWSESLVERPK